MCFKISLILFFYRKCLYIFVWSVYNLVASSIELVSKGLNHFGVIAGLFRQIGGHRVVDLCYFALFEDFSL